MGLTKMRDHQLKHIEMNLGTVCNNRCAFCMIEERASQKPPHEDAIRKEIDRYSGLGYNSIGFLGGEPTIYPAIIEIVSYASRNGFKTITIVSNGRRFSDLEFLKRIAKAGATKFYVSIHSHDPDIEDFLTKVQGGFMQKVNGIRNLVQLKEQNIIKDNIAINIVLNKKNISGIRYTLKFFKNLGIKEFRLNFIRPEGRAYLNFNSLVPRYSDFAIPLSKLFGFSKENKINLSIGDVPFCISDNPEMLLELSGESKDYINKVISFGHTEKNAGPIKETFMWKEKRKNELKQKGEACSSCRLTNICEGPWKNYVKRYGYEEFAPIK